jgi:DnaK suppressor protein
MKTADQAKFRDQLTALQDRVTSAAEEGAQAAGTVELDQSKVGRLSRMDAMQAQEMAKASQRQRLATLHGIELAFKRLEQGSYGYCLSCDEAINPRRLIANPIALLCIGCAEKGE